MKAEKQGGLPDEIYLASEDGFHVLADDRREQGVYTCYLRADLAQAPRVEEVTIDELHAILSDISMRERKWIEAYFKKNNLKITTGEGEKR